MNLENIHGFSSGQRGSFEALVCQLARREKQMAGATFRRVEGSGGDGGVEAYWLLPNGAEIGYQAKFFTRCGDIKWDQIDKSIVAALSNHRKLKKYIIAIPCDLTDRTGATGRGKTGWEHWNAHSQKWQKLARAKLRRTVEFVPWTRDDISDLLIAPESIGLREYWFGAVELSQEWLTHQLDLAVASLEERYHPEDHVDVTTQSLAEFMVRHPRSRTALREGFAAVRKSLWQKPTADSGVGAPPFNLVSAARSAIEEITTHESDIDNPTWEPWNSERWAALLDDAIRKVRHLSEWGWKAREEIPKDAPSESARNSLEASLHRWNRANSSLDELRSLVESPYLVAERTHVALLIGRAGSGKSHLLAHIAQSAVSEGRPVILLLGQQLRDEAFWPQVIQRLGLQGGTAQTLLGTLNAAAEVAGTRALLLIDAINEGAGARLWKSEIASFIAELARYPHLACVLSCRSEYVDYIIPTESKIPRFEVRGFETLEEQENAARIYLDRRGITRPAAPWLAPEFVNPLFLRSCCTALQRDRTSEFPRGLTGTKSILAFYIDSVARHLGAGRDGVNDLVGPTKVTLLDIAAAMATNKCDFVTRVNADQIAARAFALFTPPAYMGWLEVLQKNGLIRFDPGWDNFEADPLKPLSDVIRFSFQRFQDHLMADALLAGVADIRTAFVANGTLSFVIEDNSVSWEWRGLLDALSTQIPERFGIELLDALPGNSDAWWGQWPVPRAFAESVRWRDKTHFTDRTLELFNRIGVSTEISPFTLLIELSASVDHPWNAQLLHRNLIKKAMPQRDAFWTVEINSATHNERHPIWRLIDWCVRGQGSSVAEETQRLCALTLCWCLTSSGRRVRDSATKALTSLFLARKDLFRWVVASFGGVDDLYVWERIFGAAYGACCLDRAPVRLEDYATVTMESVFSKKPVLENILLRDYASGIVELATSGNALPMGIALSSSRPVFDSPTPKLTVTDAQLKRVALRADDNAILNSCTGFTGDFGIYTISHAVGRFTAVPLSKPIPYTTQEIFDRFEQQVVARPVLRAKAWEQLRKLLQPKLEIALSTTKASDLRTKDQRTRRTREVTRIKAAGTRFLSLLSPSEQQRFWLDAADYIGLKAKEKRMDPPTIDAAAARRWVARRAYAIGWTKQLFPKDVDSRDSGSRARPGLERIGKKYQWLALQQLLCSLADNYWLRSEWGSGAKVYETSVDIGFFRDIDPTIPEEIPTRSDVVRDAWMLAPAIHVKPDEQLSSTRWPFPSSAKATLSQLIYKADSEGHRWLTLYDYRYKSAEYRKKGNLSTNLRHEEFRFVLSVLVNKAHAADLIAYITKKRKIDIHDWNPPEFTDGPYLHETPWRSTWRHQQWKDDGWTIPKGLPVAFPVYDYRWESHLDASLPDGASRLVPAPWLIEECGLVAIRERPGTYTDGSGAAYFMSLRVKDDGAAGMVDATKFEDYLNKRSLSCVWLYLTERNVWPTADIDGIVRRRSEGVCWTRNGKLQVTTWNCEERKWPRKSSVDRKKPKVVRRRLRGN